MSAKQTADPEVAGTSAEVNAHGRAILSSLSDTVKLVNLWLRLNRLLELVERHLQSSSRRMR